MVGKASQPGDADSSGTTGLISGFMGYMNIYRGTLMLVIQ